MKGDKLLPKEELFCQYYANGGETFGNGRKSYALAFGKEIDTDKRKNVVDQLAWRALSKVKIIDRCNELLDKRISDEVIDRELAFVAGQRENLHAKVSAISEYNKVRGRITQKHKFEGIGDDALAEKIAERIAGVMGDDGGAGGEEEGKSS